MTVVRANADPALGVISVALTGAGVRRRKKAVVVAAIAINWGIDPLARAAYSYATPKTRQALARLKKSDDGLILILRRSALRRPRHGHGRGGSREQTR